MLEALTHTLAAAQSPPAGGAAIGQVIGATAGAMVATGILLWIIMAHRSGRIAWVGRLAGFAEKQTGLPGWASLPSALIGVSLLIAVFGMYWDISLHIDQGRDPGPLANPAHYFILVGLFGVFFCGIVSIALADKKPSPVALKITRDWWAPLGAVMILVCGTLSLMAFPLDDVWHRIFGQDVTLWGPTHLLLFGGASFSILGIWVLQVEAARTRGTDIPSRTWIQKFRDLSLAGALLIGMSTFQGEFDFGVPQFRLVWQPVLLALAAGIALVAARIRLGRGGALAGALFFIAIRGLLAVLVGPVLGETIPHFPLYLAEALIVEAVALAISTRKPVRFGLVAGALIGTVGLAAEWGWSHVFMPLPWPSELLPEALLLALPMAIAGALIGAWIGARLAADDMPRTRPLRTAAVLGSAVVAALVGFALLKPADDGVRAQVTLQEATGEQSGRHVNATVRIDPAKNADEAEWLTSTSWQGGGLVVDRLERVGPGVYRTTEPIPVFGTWKTMIRMHHGASLTAVPVYLPDDPAIPVNGVPATRTFTREFTPDHELLQREQKAAAPWLWGVGYAIVLGIALSFLALLAWGIHRAATAAEAPPVRDRTPPNRPRQLRDQSLTPA